MFWIRGYIYACIYASDVPIFSIKNEIYVNYNDNSVAYYVKSLVAGMYELKCVAHMCAVLTSR